MKIALKAVHPVLAAHDVMSSVQFYMGLGFMLEFQDDLEEPKYAVIRRDSVELHLQWADPVQWIPGLDRPVYRFLVSDIDGLYKEFLQSGACRAPLVGQSPWATPTNTPWGTREFHLRDPGQNGLQFYRSL